MLAYNRGKELKIGLFSSWKSEEVFNTIIDRKGLCYINSEKGYTLSISSEVKLLYIIFNHSV